MATKCKKPVYRETDGGILERGKTRAVIVSIEPGGILGFRLKGMHQTYRLTAEGCFMAAVKAQVAVEKKEKAKKKAKKPRQTRTVKRGVI
jgi:hypothetical protein